MDVLSGTEQLTVQGKADDTPTNITGLLQPQFPSLQRQDDLRVRIDGLRYSHSCGSALSSQLNLHGIPLLGLELD
jgi:hypothetical protein